MEDNNKIDLLTLYINQNPTQAREISIRLVESFMVYLKLYNSVKDNSDEKDVYILLMMYSFILRDFGIFPNIISNIPSIKSMVIAIETFIRQKDVKKVSHKIPLIKNEVIFEDFKEFYSEIKDKLTSETLITCGLLSASLPLNSAFDYAISDVYKKYL